MTGAGGLLGKSVVRALVHEGALVVAADLPGDSLTAIATEFGDYVATVPTDISREEDVEHLFETASLAFDKQLDFVFNNAGVEGQIGPIAELDLGGLRRTLEINVVGTAAVLKYAIRSVAAGSRIVQSGSTASLGGAAGMAPYVISKHAVLGMTRTASREVAEKGIRVNAIMPGPISGPMMTRIDEARDTRSAPTPSTAGTLDGGRLAEVSEIVSAVLFLLSDEASFIAGAGLLADGGRNA